MGKAHPSCANAARCPQSTRRPLLSPQPCCLLGYLVRSPSAPAILLPFLHRTLTLSLTLICPEDSLILYKYHSHSFEPVAPKQSACCTRLITSAHPRHTHTLSLSLEQSYSSHRPLRIPTIAMATPQSPKPIYHDPMLLSRPRSCSRRSVASLSRSASYIDSPRTACPKDGDAFSYDPAHLRHWYCPHELWVRLPQNVQSSLAAVQHSGAAVLTGKCHHFTTHLSLASHWPATGPVSLTARIY